MIPQFTLLSGTIDGVNAVFTTPTAYTAGTTAVYLNGQLLLNPAGNPWAESNPSTGTITITGLECIPRVGDVISAFYIDTQDSFTGTVVEPITGSISTVGALGGTISDTNVITAGVAEVSTICGQLAVSANISASISTKTALSGIITEC